MISISFPMYFDPIRTMVNFKNRSFHSGRVLAQNRQKLADFAQSTTFGQFHGQNTP